MDRISHMVNRLRVVKIAAFLLLVIILANLWDFSSILHQEYLRQLHQENPIASTLVFVLGVAIIKLLFVPFPTSFIAGYVFGWTLGSILSLFALCISASIAFYFSRLLREETLQLLGNKLKKNQGRLSSLLQKHGFFAVLLVRLFPTGPFVITNAVLGLSPISTMQMLSGTIIGLLPGVIILAGLGSNMLALHSMTFYVLIASALILILGSYYFHQRWNR